MGVAAGRGGVMDSGFGVVGFRWDGGHPHGVSRWGED